MGAAVKAGVAVVAVAVLAGAAQGHHHATPGDPHGWPAALLRDAREPVTRCDVAFLRAWKRAENTAAGYNPLATTMPEPGSTRFNSDGVQNYTSYRQGLKATAATFRNGFYQPLVSDLRIGDDPHQLASDVVHSKWGTRAISVPATC